MSEDAPTVPARERRRQCAVAAALNRAMAHGFRIKATLDDGTMLEGRVDMKDRRTDPISYRVGGGAQPLTWVGVDRVKKLAQA